MAVMPQMGVTPTFTSAAQALGLGQVNADKTAVADEANALTDEQKKLQLGVSDVALSQSVHDLLGAS
jgi:hypothetical protein